MAEQKKKLSAEERRRVEAQIKDLQESLEDQQEASTPAEKKKSAAEVEEERRKLAALFDRLGIGEDDWELISGAFAAGTESRTRAIVREELAAEEEAEGEAEGGLKSVKPGDPPVEPDSPPQEPPKSRHWTEKKLFGDKDKPEGEE